MFPTLFSRTCFKLFLFFCFFFVFFYFLLFFFHFSSFFFLIFLFIFFIFPHFLLFVFPYFFLVLFSRTFFFRPFSNYLILKTSRWKKIRERKYGEKKYAKIVREKKVMEKVHPTNIYYEWILRECQQSGALGMRQHFINPYKVGDWSIFIPDFLRYRYEWWCACFNKIKCRCGSKSS